MIQNIELAGLNRQDEISISFVDHLFYTAIIKFNKYMTIKYLSVLIVALAALSCTSPKEKENLVEAAGHEAHDHSSHAGPSNAKSPRTAAMANIGSNHVHIDYSAPSVRGREIFGGLVAFDEVWVTGAHSATSISFDQDLIINDQLISSGKYALFTIPGKDSWIVLLNKNYEQHLADDYDQKEDIARWEITPEVLKESVEKLTFEVIPSSANEGKIRFSWSDRAFELLIKNK